MFSTTILDVAAGVIFGFLAISLFTSAAVEAVNSFFKLRASDLKSGIMALFNDPNLKDWPNGSTNTLLSVLSALGTHRRPPLPARTASSISPLVLQTVSPPPLLYRKVAVCWCAARCNRIVDKACSVG
jgi:hypothetical protein